MFFAESNELIVIHMPLALNIYMLWEKLNRDDFETDVIEIAREHCNDAKIALNGLSRDDFSEVFLFLDLDYHSAKNNLNNGQDVIECLVKMIETFSNETESGKLYINYPMIESLKICNENVFCDMKNCVYPYSKGREFKQHIDKNGNFADPRKYTGDDWKKIFGYTVKKANCIVNGEYSVIPRSDFLEKLTQKDIFEAMSKNHIPFDRVALISGIPLFLLEYFAEIFYDKYVKA